MGSIRYEKGPRLSLCRGKPRWTDGPFTESKEVLGGYWMKQVRLNQKKRRSSGRSGFPARMTIFIEIRQVFDWAVFPPEVQGAADTPAVKAQLEKQKK